MTGPFPRVDRLRRPNGIRYDGRLWVVEEVIPCHQPETTTGVVALDAVTAVKRILLFANPSDAAELISERWPNAESIAAERFDVWETIKDAFPHTARDFNGGTR